MTHDTARTNTAHDLARHPERFIHPSVFPGCTMCDYFTGQKELPCTVNPKRYGVGCGVFRRDSQKLYK